ncbi:hypothetical protein I8752_10565 [Nostocaceae cyanobacterium CENA369]|uniref:Uncharacterized protein n=1 Tax=Dendronalium phyllosphericum CENA369 TaxID=1725256 RepID=A0A8J7I010_9NOST|nr:hypothetical protein [Dendronalium phyllosphericum]MBH8573449.1 hypothetical protein [Dendronalium phyllosphericum CENA369]
MNAKIVTALTIVAAFATLETPVRAQLPEVNSLNPQSYKLTGDSLEGVGNRTAQDDFTKFFNSKNSVSIPSNNEQKNTAPSKLRLNQTISSPETQILLQPAAQSSNGNDGVQVQLDLGKE